MIMKSKTCMIVGIICLFGFMPFAVFLNAGLTKDPIINNEIKEEEEEEMVIAEYGKFSAITSTNDDLEDLQGFRNLGYYSGSYYWAEVSGDNLIIKYSTLTGSTSTLDTYDVTTGTPTGIDVVNSVICKILCDGTDWYILAAVAFLDDNTNYYVTLTTYFFSTTTAYHDESTAAAADHKHIFDAYYDLDNTQFLLVFKVGSLVQAWEISVAGGTEGEITGADAFWEQAAIVPADADSYWVGCYDGTYYWWVVEQITTHNFYLYKADNTGTVTQTETLTGISSPAAYNLDVQLYWVKGNTEMMFDEDHFYERYEGGTWVSYSDSGSTTNGIVWKYKYARYEVAYIIWKDSIYIVTEQGHPSKIQSFTDDAYVGWDDWFCNGADTIYQYDPADISALGVFTIDKAPFAAPQIVMDGFISSFQNRFLLMYNPSSVLLTQFFIRLAKEGDFPYKYQCLSGAQIDYNRPITETYAAKTVYEVVSDLIDSYPQHLHHGRGTNGNVNIFTANQIDGTDDDWTNSDGTNCESSYVAEKVFYNSFSGKYETFEDVLQQYDNNAAGACALKYEPGAYSITSFWIGNSDVTKSTYFRPYEGVTLLCQIFIDTSNIYHYDGATYTVVKAGISNNYLYHVALVFDLTADTVDVYVNGALEQSDLGLYAAISTSPDTITMVSASGDSGYYGWFQNIYTGNSLEDAHNTLDSISPLLTTTYSPVFANKTLRDCLYTMGSIAGYIASSRPDDMFYFGDYSASGKTLTDSYYTYLGDPTPITLTPAIIAVHYNGGVKYAYGSGNGGILHYKMAELGATDAQAAANELIADKNVLITMYEIGIRGIMLDEGTWITVTSTKLSLTAQQMYITRVKYDARSTLSRLVLADAFWSPYLNNIDSDVYNMIEQVR